MVDINTSDEYADSMRRYALSTINIDTQVDVPIEVGAMDIVAQKEIWRQKVIAGTLPDAELRQWIALVRQGRMGAAISSSKARAKKAPVDMAAMMSELDSIPDA